MATINPEDPMHGPEDWTYGRRPRPPPPPEGPNWVSPLLFILILIAILSFLVYACSGASAHDAPSGHPYPEICCSPGQDSQLCHPVDCGEISEYNNQYHWQGLHFDKMRVFPSFDDQCHVCNTWDNEHKPAYGLCLMVRQSVENDVRRRWAKMYDWWKRQ